MRDQIIAEYKHYNSYRPHCTDFMTPVNWKGQFSYNQLTPDESSSYRGSFAILQTYMDKNLQYIDDSASGPISISSGYRNPQAEIDAARQNGVSAYMTSRHLAGDAVDIRSNNDPNYWKELHDPAIQAGGCVEPAQQSSYSHLHVDWRTSVGGVFGHMACSPRWRQ